MAKVSSILGEFWCCATGGAKAKVLEITKWAIKEPTAGQTSTSTDSGGRNTSIPGLKSATIDVEGRWETTESKLFGSPAVITAGAVLDFSAYLSKTALPNEYWSGTGWVSDFSTPTVDIAAGDVLTYSFTLTVNTLTGPAAA